MAALSGNISLGTNDRGPSAISGAAPKNTLEEPVTETIVSYRQMKDLRKIGFKLKFVLMPRSQGSKMEELRDWDLWGPLLFCLLLALTLSISSTGGNGEDTASLVFGIVFVVVWFGAAVVTLNALLLGGTM